MIEKDGKEERGGWHGKIVNERDEWVHDDEWIWNEKRMEMNKSVGFEWYMMDKMHGQEVYWVTE